MLVEIMMAASQNDVTFWQQKQFIQSGTCLIQCVYDKRQLMVDVRSRIKNIRFLVLGSSLCSQPEQVLGDLKSIYTVPIVFTTEKNSYELEKCIRSIGVLLYLVLPQEERVVAQMIEHESKAMH